MQKAKDIECIEKVLKGQHEYFSYLIDRYQDHSYHLSLKILKNPEKAKECTHESFIKAYTSLSSFRKDASFSTWLYRIVYNTALTMIRYSDKFNEDTDPVDLDYEKVDESTLTRTLEMEDAQKLINQALDCLKTDELFLVEQFYREDFSIAELSEMSDLSTTNVKVKLHRARHKLLDELSRILDKEMVDWRLK
jgi:RNA polymerase sigma-70 factor (ECF subfamily)